MTTTTTLRDKLLPGGKKEAAQEPLPYDETLHPAVQALLGTSDPQGLWDETLALLQTLIRNKCVNAGDGLCEEIVSIETLRAFLAGYGLECQVHHPPGKPKRPSLLATYGSGEGPRLMLGPGHVDVVPANLEIWTQDPWAAKVVDGKVRCVRACVRGALVDGSYGMGLNGLSPSRASRWPWTTTAQTHTPDSSPQPPFPTTPKKINQIYGRGSVDMLCTVAAHAVVFARIAKARVPLQGTLLFCAVSDEEAGGRDGAGCVRGSASIDLSD